MPGCALRHLDDQARRAWAAQQHRATLSRLAGVDDAVPHAVVAPTPRDGYRARAVARALPSEAGLVLGLGARFGAPPVALAECPVQAAATRTLLAQVQGALRARGVTPFDPTTETGTLRHVVVEAAGPSRRLVLVTATPTRALDDLIGPADDLGVFVDVVPPGRFDTLRRPRHVSGPRAADFVVGADRLEATLPAWLPQAPASLAAVRAGVLELLAPRADEGVLELGCGVGTLSLALARRAATVVGVDVERAAVLDAARNAAAAGVGNASFRVGRADHAVRRLLAGGQRADVVVVHAMRKPYGAEVMRPLLAFSPRVVVYVAPSPAGLARDLAAAPWLRADRLIFVDQIPGTGGLLTLARLVPA
ncbi:MAG: methyltransferase domain-containing protein [Myxococcales bacterium]|nr:methyltransferase domain-containing protein [Myxococcales bacterium]